MSERMILNRLKKLKALESQRAALDEQMEAIKAEIKADMEARGTDELRSGDFIVRWKEIVSNKFDSKRFAQEHKALYEKYLKPAVSKRFTVA